MLPDRVSNPGALTFESRALPIKVLALPDNYRFIKADLYDIKETNEGPYKYKKDSHLFCSQTRT